MEKVTFRYAEEKDTGTILEFIRLLAEYEKMSDLVVATEESLKDWLFRKKIAEVIFCEEDNVPVGFALFFHNFSTFLGKGGIYLEDLYVKEEYRSKGYGKALILELAKITRERNCGRLEWTCPDWNQPSIDFYKSIGAKPLNQWTIFRLSGEDLERAAQQEITNG